MCDFESNPQRVNDWPLLHNFVLNKSHNVCQWNISFTHYLMVDLRIPLFFLKYKIKIDNSVTN